MTKNMGTLDKLVRYVIAAIAVTLYITGAVSGTLGIILLVFAAIFVLSSLISFCLLYVPFGIKTCSKK